MSEPGAATPGPGQGREPVARAAGKPDPVFIEQLEPHPVSEGPHSIAEALAACRPTESAGAAFTEPWQVQLFAMTLALHEAGHFDWPEWAGYLSRAIGAARSGGDADLGDTCWLHWLEAFERLLQDKQIAGPLQLAGRREAIRAYSRVARSASLMTREPE